MLSIQELINKFEGEGGNRSMRIVFVCPPAVIVSVPFSLSGRSNCEI